MTNTRSKGNILLFCAHSDDQILGAGATMLKYSKEGYNVYTVIFSYGEVSHIHMQKEHVIKTRVKESEDADKIVQGSGVTFFDLRDGQIGSDYDDKKMHKKVVEIIKKYKPKKIFTHTEDDIHPDHRAINIRIIRAYDWLSKKEGFRCDIFTFELSQFWNLKKRRKPVLVVDVSSEFRQKIKALHAFKSQIHIFSHTLSVNLLYIAVYLRALSAGIRYGPKLAEVFFKVR